MLLLKEYQINAKNVMEQYFKQLSFHVDKMQSIPEDMLQDLGFEYNWAEKAWHDLYPDGTTNNEYKSKKTGQGLVCPNFCLKTPTGGGKTLMATYAVEFYLEHLRKQKTGFVLWVVPSEQIYAQTLSALQDRSHPYRERLDAVSGHRVKVITKTDRFSPNDMKENLVVLVMMLQSFSRDKFKKADLKFFKDNGKFEEFFPLETNQKKQQELYEAYPNLDLEQEFGSLLGGKVKTSFGNVVKILQPLIILDEGHKAKTEIASEAIKECNPSLVCELTATPTEKANVLFSVAGRELEKEDMIKLDLNLIEKDTVEWKSLLNYSAEHLDMLQEKASTYQKKTGIYIRPINLIQVEATGKNQRKEGKIHAEDVREHLIETGLVRPEEIRVKSSVKNELEGEDLLSSKSPVRFIITKQALQEGWDCPFAYSLTVLGGSRSKRALTQLVGRVLRQPYARKTNVKELDESYVFCLRDSSKDLVKAIRSGFEYDGMGDLAMRIASTSKKTDPDLGERKLQIVRKEYKPTLVEFSLPAFVVKDVLSEDGTRVVDPTLDITPYIPFHEVDLSPLEQVHINKDGKGVEKTVSIGFSREIAEDTEEFLEIVEMRKRVAMKSSFRKSFWVQNILEYVPNPWTAHDLVERALSLFKSMFSLEDIESNQVFLLDELRKILGGAGSKVGEIDRLARKVFVDRMDSDEIRFVPKFSFKKVLTPEHYFEKEARRHSLKVKKSLFEPVIKEGLNALEDKAVWRMEDGKETYWWYRNKARKDFFLVAWRKNRFYPDFILTLQEKNPKSFDKILLIETKGGHLLGNTDTEYKRELTNLYQRKIQRSWSSNEAFPVMPKETMFKFVEEQNLENEMNEIFA
ncbi:DEAD/DEAH box helicase family protein [Candidatus Peregrinibacteria bacterium]|jgi:type III restriction enzyme|nr:DEAD/DEAH box helicase family protein [Candidatus Peregrinibacteria bacterium]MBT4632369.1 DEAD/DEAH box helicase family protein [Candidatus Peregrinibacteria bacterium]